MDDEILPTDFQVNNGIQNESLPLQPNKKKKISKAKMPNTNSYMLGNKLKVYTSFPDIVFPEGITVVPIGEDKWIAASLEFPK